MGTVTLGFTPLSNGDALEDHRFRIKFRQQQEIRKLDFVMMLNYYGYTYYDFKIRRPDRMIKVLKELDKIGCIY